MWPWLMFLLAVYMKKRDVIFRGDHLSHPLPANTDDPFHYGVESYLCVLSRKDSNLAPSGPEPDVLPTELRDIDPAGDPSIKG